MCSRIIELGDANSKDIKKLVQAGIFDELSVCIRKYHEYPEVQYNAVRALASVSKSADAKVQKAAGNVFHAFHAVVERVRASQDFGRLDLPSPSLQFSCSFACSWKSRCARPCKS